MSKSVLITGTIVALFIPLHRYLPKFLIMNQEFIRTWNFWNIVVVLIFVFLYVAAIRSNKIKTCPSQNILLIIFLCALSISFFSVSGNAESFATYTRYILVIGSIPMIRSFYSSYSPKIIFICLSTIFVLQAQWGIAQFILQSDLGFVSIGESRIQSGIPGVATFSVPFKSYLEDGIKIIRGYGPYSHPNSFAAALVMGIIIVMQLINKKIEMRTWFLSSFYFLFIALLITFSKAGWIAGFIAVIIFSLGRQYHTRNFWHMFRPFIIVMAISLAIFMPLIVQRTNDPRDTSVMERFLGFKYAWEIIRMNPSWHGVGLGQYTLHLSSFLKAQAIPHEIWQKQPVHSVPLLLVAEWGVIPSILILLLVLYILRTFYWKKMHWLLPIIPLLLFDHYLLTQPAPLLYLVILLVGLAQTPAQELTDLAS